MYIIIFKFDLNNRFLCILFLVWEEIWFVVIFKIFIFLEINIWYFVWVLK